jgi:hypothetical protein
MTDDRKRDYPVGYRKPPRHTKFRKGRSGNPGGRPKGTLNGVTVLQRAFRETITVTDAGSGRTKKMTKLELACRQLANKAAAGDHRSIRLAMQLLQGAEDADPHQPIQIVISKSDASVL